MGRFIKNENNKILSRGWVVTIHEHCMLNVGLTEEDCKNAEKIADKFIGLWEDGTKGRRACITVSRATPRTCHTEHHTQHRRSGASEDSQPSWCLRP